MNWSSVILVCVTELRFNFHSFMVCTQLYSLFQYIGIYWVYTGYFKVMKVETGNLTSLPLCLVYTGLYSNFLQIWLFWISSKPNKAHLLDELMNEEKRRSFFPPNSGNFSAAPFMLKRMKGCLRISKKISTVVFGIVLKIWN